MSITIKCNIKCRSWKSS